MGILVLDRRASEGSLVGSTALGMFVYYGPHNMTSGQISVSSSQRFSKGNVISMVVVHDTNESAEIVIRTLQNGVDNYLS